MAPSPASDWTGETVLVTGAGGFIGCWLAERLLEEGAQVVTPLRDVDPYSRFQSEGIAERCRTVIADVLDYEALVRVLKANDIGTVFHLAAQPIVGIAKRSPHSTFESNVRGACTLLEACRAARLEGASIERIVVASTDHAYGAHDELPYREDFAFKAQFPYDVSKACADLIARSYAEIYEMPVAVTRMANTYGPGDLNWSRIVPDCVRALVEESPPVIRSDGTPQRDYLYVEDAVKAYLMVARSLEETRYRGRAWNVGVGEPVSVLDLVRTLIDVSGRQLEPDVRGKGTPEGEIDRQYLDSSAIRDELGWAPRWDLERGLSETYRWYERTLGASAGPVGHADPAPRGREVP